MPATGKFHNRNRIFRLGSLLGRGVQSDWVSEAFLWVPSEGFQSGRWRRCLAGGGWGRLSPPPERRSWPQLQPRRASWPGWTSSLHTRVVKVFRTRQSPFQWTDNIARTPHDTLIKTLCMQSSQNGNVDDWATSPCVITCITIITFCGLKLECSIAKRITSTNREVVSMQQPMRRLELVSEWTFESVSDWQRLKHETLSRLNFFSYLITLQQRTIRITLFVSPWVFKHLQFIFNYSVWQHRKEIGHACIQLPKCIQILYVHTTRSISKHSMLVVLLSWAELHLARLILAILKDQLQTDTVRAPPSTPLRNHLKNHF